MQFYGQGIIKVLEKDIKEGILFIDSDVRSLARKACENLENLEQVVVSNGCVDLGYDCFSGCSNLEKIDLPDTLQKISFRCFLGCHSLKQIKIPDRISKLYVETFNDCSSLETVFLPRGIEEIGDKVFISCCALKNINLPINLKKIGKGAFYACKSLESLKIPKNIQEIDEASFGACEGLRKIELPTNLKEIKNGAFAGCSSLENIMTPEKSVSENFGLCVFPDGLEKIGPNAFQDCSEIREVILPVGLKELGESVFENCANLTSISLPKGLEKLPANAFYRCGNLKKIEFNESLKEIGSNCFLECDSLEEIVLPNSVERINDNAFVDCANLKRIEFPATIQKIDFESIDFEAFPYLSKVDGKFILSDKPEKNAEVVQINEKNRDYLSMIITNWEVRDKIIKDCKDYRIGKLYYALYDEMDRNLFTQFVKDKSFRFFNQFKIDDLEYNNYAAFVKFFYNMGGFNSGKTELKTRKNGVEKIKTYDFAQMIGEFVKERTKDGSLKFSMMEYLFSGMDIKKFSPEYTEFFIRCFDDLMAAEAQVRGFISRTYNEFDRIQKSNTSNKGKQERKKVTVPYCARFFTLEDVPFKGVNDSNLDIALEIINNMPNPTQQMFDDALSINQERIEKNVPDNIISEDMIKRYLDPDDEEFIYIDERLKEIDSEIFEKNREMLECVGDLADTEYSFEWLRKSSPINFVLGKYCTCCSHLDGVGYSIMRASIIHPSIQSLVIKNGDGEIIAKSTIYVNQNEGYGVFNNVEVNDNVNGFDKIYIYTQFKKGLNEFVMLYNKEHPLNPIRQINVGMSRNDLYYELRQNDEKAKDLLTAIDYSPFGRGLYTYGGDSSQEQYVVWKMEEEKDERER